MASSGKLAELSNIIWHIMDTAYPPIPPKAMEEALATEALTTQHAGEWSVIPAEPTMSHLVTERQLH